MVGEVVSNLSRCSRPESTPRRTCTILFSPNRAIECGQMVLIGMFRVVSTCWSIGRTFPGSDFICSHHPCIYAPCLFDVLTVLLIIVLSSCCSGNLKELFDMCSPWVNMMQCSSWSRTLFPPSTGGLICWSRRSSRAHHLHCLGGKFYQTKIKLLIPCKDLCI